jgi:hypothetical protein
LSGMNSALPAAPATNAPLNSMSYREKTRPRKSSSTSCWRVVVAQMATPCATTPSRKPMTRKPGCEKPVPRAAVVMPPAASRIVIQVVLASRRVASGVTTAAAPYPIAEATTMSR